LGGEKRAVKWYFPSQATPEQYEALAKLIERGRPTRRFLWPEALVKADDVPGYGYTMPLRGSHYQSIVALMKRRAEPSFRALATAGLQLASSYLELHANGLCYRDISFGNVFFDPDSGEVLICDNDNVTFDNETDTGVLGTPRFMAPEIVRGEALPSIQTDLYSLAVLLFYILMVHHPLEGRRELEIKCLDLPAMTMLYGSDPIFIFDPDDDSNRPVSGYHDNAIVFWSLYPEYLRNLFTRAFTAGIEDPLNGRVRETEWRQAMVRLRDSIFYCHHCGMENFYDLDALKASGGQPGRCWSCDRRLMMPPRIRIEDDIVMLNHNTKLYPHHIDPGRSYDFHHPIGEVVQHPNDPSVWGVQNAGHSKWVVSTDGGVTNQDVAIGQSVRISYGTSINFGKREGQIR
jgi:serine/threonine protein kinase